MNLFDIVPSNFFNILTRENQQIMVDCLFVLYEYTKDDIAYSTSKENAIFELTQYLNRHPFALKMEDQMTVTDSSEQARHIYTRLKSSGWVHEELAENYEIRVSFEDYAIDMLETFKNLGKSNDIEYSGMVYSIYQAFYNFDITKGDYIFETQYHTMQDLMNKLKMLNTSIKKYIQKLLKDNIKDDLNGLLDSLLSDYQVMVVDRAFYNLTTKDHPQKYRSVIIDKINMIIHEEEHIEVIVKNIMDHKGIDYPSAREILFKQANFLVESLDNMDLVIEEISGKNQKFVDIAINRILFLLNVKEDISGKINAIIKDYSLIEDEIDEVINVSRNQVIDKDSLYTPLKSRTPIQANQIIDITLNENKRQEAFLKVQQNEKYSRKFLEKYVLELLEKHGPLKGSELFDQYNDDVSTFVLIWLYGYSKNVLYQIVPKDEIVYVKNYKFKDFTIRRKEHDKK